MIVKVAEKVAGTETKIVIEAITTLAKTVTIIEEAKVRTAAVRRVKHTLSLKSNISSRSNSIRARE